MAAGIRLVERRPPSPRRGRCARRHRLTQRAALVPWRSPITSSAWPRRRRHRMAIEQHGAARRRSPAGRAPARSRRDRGRGLRQCAGRARPGRSGARHSRPWRAVRPGMMPRPALARGETGPGRRRRPPPDRPRRARGCSRSRRAARGRSPRRRRRASARHASRSTSGSSRLSSAARPPATRATSQPG